MYNLNALVFNDKYKLRRHSQLYVYPLLFDRIQHQIVKYYQLWFVYAAAPSLNQIFIFNEFDHLIDWHFSWAVSQVTSSRLQFPCISFFFDRKSNVHKSENSIQFHSIVCKRIAKSNWLQETRPCPSLFVNNL